MEMQMSSKAAFALAHPVFDPERQITKGHSWWEAPLVSALLTVNIGME